MAASAPGARLDSPLASLIDDLAPHLPAQGPISIFIHHNTLHAFEHLRFEEAVARAGRQFGCEPFLAESRYRDKLAAGRIRAGDIDAVLQDQLGESGRHPVPGIGSRFDLWRAVVHHGLPEAAGRELAWILGETDALQTGPDLWTACLDAVRRAGPRVAAAPATPVRHRDWLQATHDLDTDAWIHPPLIRFLAGYLDQGLAPWPMPARPLGIHGGFLELYGRPSAARCGTWANNLPRLVIDDRRAGRGALDSVSHSLAQLGVSDRERSEYLEAELLALRGWAGMVRQIEERPDRVPARDVLVTLRGYLAVRLLFERAALAHAAQEIGFDGPLAALRPWLHRQLRPLAAPTVTDRAWPLFNVAQRCGLGAAAVDRWSGGDVEAVESDLRTIDGVRRREILHLAFERTIRHRLYDALVQHTPPPSPQAPAFQAVFCLDEREESFRRHLEEIDPACETFSTAGFFNVAMYHRGATDAHPRPLCPAVIRPEHYVAEVEPDRDQFAPRRRRWQRRAAGVLGYNIHAGSRRPVHGAVLMTLVGWLAIVPLIVRAVFPWLFSRWARLQQRATATAQTRLQVRRDDRRPPIGAHTGFTVREMADIVRRVLDDLGLRDRLSPLVLVLGHGSVSLNNPHESAHDCGACGGGRGGPNARAFAQMANDPDVRQLLAAEGLVIDSSTWFVGGQRNTCNNDVPLFDVDLVPASCRPALDRAQQALDAARAREAHERCRRFDAAPGWYSPRAALAHVEGRAADLAQPRPEYGHATNAFCIVGRRERTRGLFLDRRAFLTSYDPTRDEDDSVLARMLAAVVPVVAGISLEYYFSYVDPTGYGCGTKLPHNVTALLGVMDGAQSDLRTGLPWQMVEIHEPARLALVIESTPERVSRVVQRDPSMEQLVRNRWIWLACLDASSDALWEFGQAGWTRHAADHPLPVVDGPSAAWYQARRGFVPPASILGVAAS